MSIFSKLFFKKPILPLADISLVHTDMHSHFIPGIDDGVQTMDESINLIRGLIELGYKKIITTPHIMSDTYRNTPKIINEGLAKVKTELIKQNINIEMQAAAEYYIDFDFRDRIGKEKLMTFGNNFILVEVSYLNEPDGIEEVLFELQTNGYNIILAHPERYPFWYGNWDRYVNLKDRGIYFQMNINSLAGYYSPTARAIAIKMIDNDMIEFIGTDCHNANHQTVMQNALREPAMHKLIQTKRLLNNML